MGNAGNDIFSTHDNGLLHSMLLHKGAGIGVVWLSPVGSLQLSLAQPLDRPDAPAMVQFSMGPEL